MKCRGFECQNGRCSRHLETNEPTCVCPKGFTGDKCDEVEEGVEENGDDFKERGWFKSVINKILGL